jgi:hypothetical protein
MTLRAHLAKCQGGATKYFTPWLLCLALLMVSPRALSQDAPVPYLKDNTGLSGFFRGPGIRLRTERIRGIRAGKFIIWPSLMIEGRYDSNVFQEDAQENPTASPVLRILPGFAITNTNANKFALSLGLQSDVRLYLTENKTVRELRDFGVKTDLRVDILPKGPVTVSIIDVFRRELETPNYSTSQTFDQNFNKAGIRVGIHPGGGALNIELGYAYAFNLFEDFPDSDFAIDDFQFHEFELMASWRFYPKTAMFISANGKLRTWNGSKAAKEIYIDSNPFRVYAGLNGFFTKKLAALLKVGYGHSFHDSGESYEHVVGHAEVAYKITRTTLLAVGYSRDFVDSFYANFYTDNHIYLRFNTRILRRLGIQLNAGYHLIDYARFDPVDQGLAVQVRNKERRDQGLNVHAQISFDITRWIGVSVGYELRSVMTDFWTKYLSPDNQERLDLGSFVKHQVYSSVDVRY